MNTEQEGKAERYAAIRLEMSAFSKDLDVIDAAFTLWTKVPSVLLQTQEAGDPRNIEAIVKLARTKPDVAKMLIEKAREEGSLRE